MDACRICSNKHNNKIHRAREMMFGMLDEFDYLECADCGCIQISSIPDSLSKYYPSHYWDFQRSRMQQASSNYLRQHLRKRIVKYWLSSKRDPIGRLLSIGNVQPRHIGWLRRAGIDNFSTKILDVGCGLGDRLLTLQHEGFEDLTGIDPYIDANITYTNNIKIYNRSIYDQNGQYGFITLHHSYEHMPDPIDVMNRLYSLCEPGGKILIRVPLADSYAWKKYGVNWIQLDAPRHLYLHTRKSITLLAENAGFELIDLVYDSDATQFWGSEQYSRNISLYDDNSYELHPENSIFTPEQINSFRKKAWELNHSQQGDQACFYLRKTINGN